MRVADVGDCVALTRRQARHWVPGARLHVLWGVTRSAHQRTLSDHRRRRVPTGLHNHRLRLHVVVPDASYGDAMAAAVRTRAGSAPGFFASADMVEELVRAAMHAYKIHHAIIRAHLACAKALINL